MVSETEFEFLVANLAAEALCDQELEIRLVIHSEYLGWSNQRAHLSSTVRATRADESSRNQSRPAWSENQPLRSRRHGGAVHHRRRRSASSPGGQVVSS